MAEDWKLKTEDWEVPSVAQYATAALPLAPAKNSPRKKREKPQ
jgi:hypothetical protein